MIQRAQKRWIRKKGQLWSELSNMDPSKQDVLLFNQKSMVDKKRDRYSTKQEYNKVQKVEVEAKQTQAGIYESN